MHPKCKRQTPNMPSIWLCQRGPRYNFQSGSSPPSVEHILLYQRRGGATPQPLPRRGLTGGVLGGRGGEVVFPCPGDHHSSQEAQFPSLGSFWTPNSDSCPKSAQTCPKPPKLCPNWSRCTQTNTKPAQRCPNSAENPAHSLQLSDDSSRSAQTGQNLFCWF